jgi:hypothetical protein
VEIEMGKTIVIKIITAILATIILCLLLSIIGYTPINKQEPNTSYMTFNGLFVLYLIFTAPILITVGIIFSTIVDRMVKGNLKTILTYIIGGGILGLLYYLFIVLNQASPIIFNQGILLFVSLGAFSSLLFYRIQLSLKPVFEKLNFN